MALKIAFIRRKYTDSGGAEKIVDMVSKRLAGMGYEVCILANKWSVESSGLKLLKVPVVSLGSFFKTLSFAVGAYFICKKEKFDIVQSNEKTFMQDIYRAGDGCHREWLKQRHRQCGFPARFFQSINPFHLLVLFLERQIMKNSLMIVANAQRVKDDIIHNYNVPSSRIQVVYNPVNSPGFSPGEKASIRHDTRKRLGRKESDTVFLFVGSGFERKGLKYLLSALKLASDNSFYLWVLGKGTAITGIYESTTFLGTSKDLPAYYCAADAFVLPSIYDPFPNAALEAMSFGLPVVTTRICGASEIITDGENGFVIDEPHDIKKLAHLLCLLKDKDKRQSMGKRAKERVSSFSLEKTVASSISIFDEVLKLKRKGDGIGA